MSDTDTIVKKTAETLLASTETIDRLASRIDAMAVQMQQQGYQIFALSDAIQTLAENQDSCLQQINQLTQTLQNLTTALEIQNKLASQNPSRS